MPTFCDQSIAELEIYVASEFAKPFLKYIWHDLLHRLGVVPLERSTTGMKFTLPVPCPSLGHQSPYRELSYQQTCRCVRQ